MPSPLQRLWAKLGIPADYARSRHLPVQRVAARLVRVDRAADDDQLIRLAPAAAAAWRRLRVAAAADGHTLLLLSGYRSVARQTRVIRRQLATGKSINEILRFVAAPGCSEHHTGRAIDLAAPSNLHLDGAFARTPEYRWLRRNAARFGFTLSYPARNPHRIGFEPWHWCWRARR
ncbi:MAG: M15 family metallopeptidase [Candidatus Didemnitutus sp.]|nr:M15 family metallopeptidase [Candidatus Didemnitutus sp.]